MVEADRRPRDTADGGVARLCARIETFPNEDGIQLWLTITTTAWTSEGFPRQNYLFHPAPSMKKVLSPS
jgi:hypothetical protein